jgi:hypothetical protein
MATATLRTLFNELALPGIGSLNHLVKKSGFLQVAEAIPASHGASHKYKRVEALPTFSIINPGGSVGDTTVNSDILTVDMKIVRAQQSEPSDLVDDWPSGQGAYFNSQQPSYLESFGQKASGMVYYGTDATHGDVSANIGLHQIAKAYGNRTDAGGDSGSTTSIFAVKFRSGQNGCGLLYDPAITSGAEIMKSELLNGGSKVLEVTNTTGNLKKSVYQVQHSGKLAFLSSSAYDVSVIHSIQDATNDRPTASEMDNLLDQVRWDGEDTFIFMNRLGRRMLSVLNDSKLQTNPGSTDYYSWLSTWAGCPIIIDDNILSTETSSLD